MKIVEIGYYGYTDRFMQKNDAAFLSKVGK
jgi:hypothetical protein